MRFYFLGDMGTGLHEQYFVSDALSSHIQTNKKPVFVCGLGDNIYERGCKSINDHKFKSIYD